MRLHYVLVLSVVALLAPTNATLGSKVSTINFSARQLYRHSNDVPTKRRLRSHDNNEERVPSIKTGTERISKSAQNVLGRYSDDLSVKQTTVFKTLQARYSDAKLSELLIAGKRIQSTEKLAVELQKQQIRVWMDTFEHPETVFKLLMLDKAGENVLSNPQLKVWIDYAFSFKQHTKGNPLMKQTTLIDTLMKNYDDKALAIIIDTAKKSSNAKLMGSYVESALLGKWAIDNKPLGYVVKILGTTADEKLLVRTQYLENLGKLQNVEGKKVRGWLYNLESPDTVFKLLKLDQDNNLLASPLLDDWVNYDRAFKDRTKGNAAITQTTLIDTLMKNYDDRALVTIINTAKNSGKSDIKAKYVENELIGKWAIDNKPVEYVTNMLGTSVEASYLRNLEVFKKVTDKRLRRMLYDWQTPETAFTFLKLNNGDNPLAKPELKEWIKYMNAFNDRIIGNPTVTKTTLIDMLMKNYDDQALYTIIATAKQSADSNMMAKYIESELISNWLVSGRPLAFISKTLGKTREEKSHVQKLYLKKIKKLEKDM